LKSKLIPTIRRIHQLAFGRDQEADIVEDMRHRAGAMLSLVAIRRGELVGHAFFSRVIIECASGFDRGVGLAPIAVLPEHQRTGLGTDLVRHAIAALKNRRQGIMVVVGEPAFYQRFGFKPARTFGLRCSYEAPADSFMALPLDPGWCGAGGLVRYAPAFDGAE
jgi:putative acetyltransferase